MIIYYVLQSNFSILEALAIILAYIIAILFAISCHEFSHSYIAYKQGDTSQKVKGRLTLNPFAHLSLIGAICFILIGFGWAKPVGIDSSKFKNIKKGLVLVSLSGVIANLILAFIFSGIYAICAHFGAFDIQNTLLLFVEYLLYFAIIINIALFFFNLLPIPPLDGFNFISALTKYGNRFIAFMQSYGTIILMVLIISQLYSMLYTYVVEGIFTIFFMFWGLFL